MPDTTAAALKKTVATAVLFVFGLLASACSAGSPVATQPPSGVTPGGPADSTPSLPEGGYIAPNATLERVVDGDTIVVDVGEQRERVRLIGIDTPESVDENRPVQCYGPEASTYLKSLLPPGTALSLVRDVEARDRYGRLLAYVVRTDDQLFVNLDLVQQGYAGSLTYLPNDHYAQLFETAADDAAASGIGLWGACGGPDVPLG